MVSIIDGTYSTFYIDWLFSDTTVPCNKMEDRYAKIDFIEERKYANFEFHTYLRRVAVPQLHVFVNITWRHKLMDQIAYISW